MTVIVAWFLIFQPFRTAGI